MNHPNPYEAPQAPLHNINRRQERTVKQLLFSFQGRVNRKEFWLLITGAGLGYLGVATAMTVVLGLLGLTENLIGFLILPLVLPASWVQWAAYVKRCHDRDKSGWFTLIGLLPIIGGLWLLVELGFLQGTAGDNLYGPAPLA